MIVAITGATGSVGKKLVHKHLAAGDTVRALSRRPAHGLPYNVEVHPGGLTGDAAALERFVDDADVLYHCAAELRDETRMMEVNAHGTGALVTAADRRIGRWVQLSSIAVYGAPQARVIDEDAALQPVDVYGRSKADAERRVREAAERGAFLSAIVRPAKVFGVGIASGNNEILFQLFSLVRRGLFFFIGKPGALTHYVHVDNLVEALERCGRATLRENAVYNLSDDRTIEDFVQVIADALARPTPKLRLPQAPVELLARAFGRVPGFPLHERRVAALVNRVAIPCERIRRSLGYVHPVPIERGLPELVRAWSDRA